MTHEEILTLLGDYVDYLIAVSYTHLDVYKRQVYYIPSILGGSVAIAVLWKAVFRDDGLVNTIIRAITFGHAQGPSWLSDPNYCLLYTSCGASALSSALP